MKVRTKAVLAVALLVAAGPALAATEQAKQLAIDKGLAYYATPGTYGSNSTEMWYSFANNGTLAATASMALAYIEEGHLPGQDFIDLNGNNRGDIVGKMCNYIFNRATADSRFPSGGYETAGYVRYAEDYNGNLVLDDGGNNQAIYFNPASSSRNVYTTGLCAPVVYALGEALGKNTLVGRGSLTSSMTYGQVMQDVVDWFSWAQVEPNMGNHRGGWRYDATYTTSDNSTAQWGALPILYAKDWGLNVPQYVKNELNLWIKYIQNANGGSGYDNPGTYVNVSKTGGLLLEIAAVDPLTDPLRPNREQEALDFIDSRWMTTPSGTWYGNLNHPYAMWAVYKALFERGMIQQYGSGLGEDFLIGFAMSNAPGGILIGQDWWDGVGGNPAPAYSQSGDWYSHYCDYLVGIQNSSGSWGGYSYWTGAMATGWYINILNAAGAPPPVNVIPEPLTVLGVLAGVAGLAGYIRKRRA